MNKYNMWICEDRQEAAAKAYEAARETRDWWRLSYGWEQASMFQQMQAHWAGINARQGFWIAMGWDLMDDGQPGQ